MKPTEVEGKSQFLNSSLWVNYYFESNSKCVLVLIHSGLSPNQTGAAFLAGLPVR